MGTISLFQKEFIVKLETLFDAASCVIPQMLFPILRATNRRGFFRQTCKLTDNKVPK